MTVNGVGFPAHTVKRPRRRRELYEAGGAFAPVASALAHGRPVYEQNQLRVRLMLAALREWADNHGGQAPRRSDLTPQRVGNAYPTTAQVDALFAPLAIEAGLRTHHPCPNGLNPTQPASSDCPCLRGACTWYRQTDGTLKHLEPACRGSYVTGISGWRYALGLAGLDVRHAADGLATNAAEPVGRNRQMVTGGDLGAKRRPEHC